MPPLISKPLQSLPPYHAPSAQGMLKLDAMENPYPLPPSLKRQWLTRLAEVDLNRYPDPSATPLKTKLRTTHNIDPAHAIVLGNGSDELIQMLALLVAGRSRVIMAPTPTFAMYRRIALTTNSRFIPLPLTPAFDIDPVPTLNAITKHRPACIFISYPNNPTGNCFTESAIHDIIKHAPGLIVIDEAYFPFSHRTFLPHLPCYPNLIILRTLSKAGMAGLRLGWATCHPHWAEHLEKTRLPYNISTLTQTSAQFYLDHHRILIAQAAKITRHRHTLATRLAAISTIQTWHSQANFIMFKPTTPPPDGPTIHTRLKRSGILIKNLHLTDHRLSHCLRVTVGTPSENTHFLKSLTTALT